MTVAAWFRRLIRRLYPVSEWKVRVGLWYAAPQEHLTLVAYRPDSGGGYRVAVLLTRVEGLPKYGEN